MSVTRGPHGLRFLHRQAVAGGIVATADRKCQLIGRLASDRDEPVVVSFVMSAAQQDEVRRIVRSAVLAMHDVVDLEKAR